jgi:hypothetical protein
MQREWDFERLSFVEGELSPLLVARSFTLAAGCERRYEHSEWADAIVVVHQGEIELECLAGTCARFGTGAVLCFDSLPLRTLRNGGRGPALLIAVSRRAGASLSTSRSAMRAAAPGASATDESRPSAASHQ